MKRVIKLLGLVLIVILSSGCNIQKPISRNLSDRLSARDTVMLAGQTIVFKNPNGTGKITYVSDFTRRYEIAGSSFNVELVQRAEEWRHKRGIYNPGETWGPLMLADATPSRFVVDESVVRFSNNEECERFFKVGAAYEKWVSGENGLVLGFDSSPGRDQVNVSLYRCYVAGKLMRQMPSKFEYPGFVHLQ